MNCFQQQSRSELLNIVMMCSVMKGVGCVTTHLSSGQTNLGLWSNNFRVELTGVIQENNRFHSIISVIGNLVKINN